MLSSVQPSRCQRRDLGDGTRRSHRSHTPARCGVGQGVRRATEPGERKTAGRSRLMPDFLLEIGCDEIPARMIDGAWQELCQRVTTLLVRELLWKGEPVQPGMTGIMFRQCATPRRLALLIPSV